PGVYRRCRGRRRHRRSHYCGHGDHHAYQPHGATHMNSTETVSPQPSEEAIPMNDVVTTNQSFSLSPKSLDEAMQFANMLSKSTIVPKDFQNNPGNILVAVQWGMELGLQPMQAMQNIAVINGRPALW